MKLNTKRSIEIWNERYAEESTGVAKVDKSGDPVDYTCHPFLWETSINTWLKQKGGTELEIGKKYFSPARENALAIGSGIGVIERDMIKKGYIKKLTVYETSKDAIERFKKLAIEDGTISHITFIDKDILEDNIPADTYDAVLVFAAIHHFFEIERMFKLIYKVIKRDGVLYYDEYIGADHCMYEDKIYKYLNEINDCLAAEYRKDELNRNRVREEVPRADLKWQLEQDPSEAVHSSQILPLTYKYFNVLGRFDYGGTMMRPFWVGILNNFDFLDEKDKTIASLICYIERLLIKEKILPHYHTRIVAQKRRWPKELPKAKVERISYEGWK